MITPNKDDYYVHFDCGCVAVMHAPAYRSRSLHCPGGHWHETAEVREMWAIAREAMNKDFARRSALN